MLQIKNRYYLQNPSDSGAQKQTNISVQTQASRVLMYSNEESIQ